MNLEEKAPDIHQVQGHASHCLKVGLEQEMSPEGLGLFVHNQLSEMLALFHFSIWECAGLGYMAEVDGWVTWKS